MLPTTRPTGIRFVALGSMLPLLLALGLGLAARRRALPLEPGSAQVAVARFFEAVSRQSCAAVKDRVTGKLAAELARNGCEATLERMRAHRVEYVGSAEPKIDGRDRQALLVPIQLRFDGKPRAVTVRVVASGDGWKLATL